MKIAVACEGSVVTGHFGHCQNFMIFDVENNQIVNTKSVPNPGHRPGYLPNYLNDLGTNVIISGGMGGGAIEIFDEKGIQVVIGVAGDAKAAVEKFIKGELKSTGSACDKHEHEGNC